MGQKASSLKEVEDCSFTTKASQRLLFHNTKGLSTLIPQAL